MAQSDKHSSIQRHREALTELHSESQRRHITIIYCVLAPTRKELGPGGAALRGRVVVLQPHPHHCELVQIGGPDLAAMVADVVVAQVVCHNHYDVRPSRS